MKLNINGHLVKGNKELIKGVNDFFSRLYSLRILVGGLSWMA